MRLRVLERYSFERVPAAHIALLDSGLTPALRTRERRLGAHDARLLHPARTVLILLDDARIRDPVLLAAAALLESDDVALAPDLEGQLLDLRVSALLQQVPMPAAMGERLLEALVSAPPAVRLIACAERLDLARHCHLVPGSDQRVWLRQVERVYIPLAARTEPLLARRFERWAGALIHRLARE